MTVAGGQFDSLATFWPTAPELRLISVATRLRLKKRREFVIETKITKTTLTCWTNVLPLITGSRSVTR